MRWWPTKVRVEQRLTAFCLHLPLLGFAWEGEMTEGVAEGRDYKVR